MLWKLKVASYRANHKIMGGLIRLLPFKEPQVLLGDRSLLKLPAEIKKHSISTVLVVTDETLLSLGLLEPLLQSLKTAEIQATLYAKVQPNPTLDNVEEAAELYVSQGCEGIIAFGGGSPMDCAKIAGARIANPSQPIASMKGLFKLRKPLPPLFAVPTTAGTGSETTIAAVISNPKKHEKYAVVDFKLLPKVAVLDPELTVNLPPFITSTTGMDALTHAIEAYIGLHGTSYTNLRAEMAVKLIFEHLESTVQNEKQLEKRQAMALASYYAGAAFTQANVGYVHAIAHTLGGLYGTPHGLANAVILPHVLEAYGSAADQKLSKLAVLTGIGNLQNSNRTNAMLFIAHIKSMNERMNHPAGLKDIQKKDLPLIAQKAAKEANPAYPVPKILSAKALEKVVERLYPQ